MNKLENVKLLFCTNYWDGPIAGLCEHDGKYYRFAQLQDDEWDEVDEEWLPRVYKAYEILPWQLSYELYWYSLFISNVKGARSRSDFEEGLKNERFIINENYYKKREKEYRQIDYTKNNVIGTFTFYERRIV